MDFFSKIEIWFVPTANSGPSQHRLHCCSENEVAKQEKTTTKQRPGNSNTGDFICTFTIICCSRRPISNPETLNNVLEKKILLVQLCELHLKQLYKWDPCKSVQGPIKVQELAKLEKQRKKSIQVSNSDLYFYFNETLEK